MNLDYLIKELPCKNSGDGWSNIDTLHSLRADHSAVELKNGNILAAGGTIGADIFASNTSKLYNVSSRAWSGICNMNTGRRDFALMALSEGGALAIGGLVSNTETLLSSELYDEDNNIWVSAGNLNQARQSFCAVELMNGNIIAIGGAVREGQDDTSLATVESYSPVQKCWRSVASMSTPRAAFTATRLNDGKVLVAGGVNVQAGLNRKILSSAEIYDPATDMWHTASDMHFARESACAVLLNDGRILVMGGGYEDGITSGAKPLASCEIYNPETNRWEDAASLAQPRMLFMSTLMANGNVMVMGGLQAWDTILKECEQFNPALNAWSSIDNLLISRYGPMVKLHTGHVVLCGGLSGTIFNATSTCELHIL